MVDVSQSERSCCIYAAPTLPDLVPTSRESELAYEDAMATSPTNVVRPSDYSLAIGLGEGW